MPEEFELIVSTLKGNIVQLSKDPQGNHVVQKVLQNFEPEMREFIFEEVYKQFIDLAKNTNGLCVVKKLIQIYKPVVNPESDQERSILDHCLKLLKKIRENVIDLVQDPYGNYAVTEVITVKLISVFITFTFRPGTLQSANLFMNLSNPRYALSATRSTHPQSLKSALLMPMRLLSKT